MGFNDTGFGGVDWIDLVHDVEMWQTVVNTVTNIKGTIKCGKFSD